MNMLQTHLIRPWFAHRRRPSGQAIELIVLHATAGATLAGAVATLRERGLGYHYLIDKSGAVYKGCPVLAQTGHAGNSYGPREADAGVDRKQNRKGEFNAKCSVNPYSLGISFVNLNDGVDPYTAAQERAVRDLIVALKAVLPELSALTTHAIVSPRRKNDPLGFDVDALARDVGLAVWRG